MMRPPRRLQEHLDEARRLHDLGKLNKAAVPARRAYALAAEHLPYGHPSRQEAARTLGSLLLNLNQGEEAKRLLRESGDLPGDEAESPRLQMRNNEVFVRMQAGVTPDLARYAEGVLAEARAEAAPDSDPVTVAMANLGQIRENLGDLGAAEKLFAEVLELRRRNGSSPDLLVPALLDMARLRLRSGRHVKAEPLYREALQLQEGEGEAGFEMAITLNQLASVCMQLGRNEEALAHLERSLQLRRQALGGDHPQIATALHGLAALHLKLERHDEADAALETAWRILDRSLGEADPRTIQFLMERGMVRLGQGQPALGLEHLRRAEDLAARALPRQHPLRQQIAATIAAALELRDRIAAGGNPAVAVDEVNRLHREGNLDAAWAALRDLRPHLGRRRDVALAWARLLRAAIPADHAWRSDFAEIMEAWARDLDVVEECCRVLLEDARSRELDEGPHASAELALELAEEAVPPAIGDQRGRLLELAARAWRRLPGGDPEEALAAHRRSLDHDPAKPAAWHALGTMLKLLGRFAEGVEALQKAVALGGNGEALSSDLGICATGAGDTEAALQAWRALGLDPRPDERFGVRVEGLEPVKVRLSSRGPLTQPWPWVAEDDEPRYDHAWVFPLSPCHGMVMTPTVFNTSADAGDVVLWDLPPVAESRHLHLAVLQPSTRPILRFVARQPEPGALQALDAHLPSGTILSVASECATLLCGDCARGTTHHEHGLLEPPAPGVVFGKLVARSAGDLPQVRERWEELTRGAGIEVACPALYHALGEAERAAEHEARWKVLDPGR